MEMRNETAPPSPDPPLRPPHGVARGAGDVLVLVEDRVTHKWHIGQRVVRVMSPRGRPQFHTGTITKIGRKYGYLDSGLQFPLATGWVDSFFGRIYASRAEYKAELELSAAWDEFRKMVSHQYHVPDAARLAEIKAALDRVGRGRGVGL
jgi:hypothetical protein